MAEENMNLSENAQKVMEIVEKMTVLELSELVKAMEEKFGVSAAAAVAVAGPASGAPAEAEPEKDQFDVVIVSAGEQKIAVIKAVRAIDQNLGLAEAKALVESGEAVVMQGAKKEAANEAKAKLEEAGAKVELR